jgi:hypothetical protein
MTPQQERERTPPRFVAIALGTALAPFVVQTTTMVLSGSVGLTLFAGALLAATVAWLALAFQARVAGGWSEVPLGARVGIVLAVVTYQAIAFPVARIVEAVFFQPPG